MERIFYIIKLSINGKQPDSQYYQLRIGLLLWLGQLDSNQRNAGVKVLCLSQLGYIPMLQRTLYQYLIKLSILFYKNHTKSKLGKNCFNVKILNFFINSSYSPYKFSERAKCFIIVYAECLCSRLLISITLLMQDSYDEPIQIYLNL